MRIITDTTMVMGMVMNIQAETNRIFKIPSLEGGARMAEGE